MAAYRTRKSDSDLGIFGRQIVANRGRLPVQLHRPMRPWYGRAPSSGSMARTGALPAPEGHRQHTAVGCPAGRLERKNSSLGRPRYRRRVSVA